MEIRDLHQYLEARLDKIEEKLDTYQSRISRAEEALEWVKGSVKMIAALGVAALSAVVAAIWNKFIV
jgi:chaperonin cofactor prefoldin